MWSSLQLRAFWVRICNKTLFKPAVTLHPFPRSQSSSVPYNNLFNLLSFDMFLHSVKSALRQICTLSHWRACSVLSLSHCWAGSAPSLSSQFWTLLPLTSQLCTLPLTLASQFCTLCLTVRPDLCPPSHTVKPTLYSSTLEPDLYTPCWASFVPSLSHCWASSVPSHSHWFVPSLSQSDHLYCFPHTVKPALLTVEPELYPPSRTVE